MTSEQVHRLSMSALTLYAELTSQLVTARLQHRGLLPPGVLVTKEIRGQKYWYIQYDEAGKRRQVYLGPHASVGERLDELRERWEDWTADDARMAQLSAMLRAAGLRAQDSTTARVLEVLQMQGIFDVGTVIVGSLAFAAYEGMLGVRWGAAYRTADIDVASARALALALPRRADLQAALESTGLPFDEVPALDPRNPSTSFKLRRKELRVDVLIPEVGKPGKGPVLIPELGVAAQPVRFLDYLLEGAAPATLLARSGVLVNVPDPARFALHKLLVSTRRPVTEATKAAKDVQQASQLITVLGEDRPGDLAMAWDALYARGKGWWKPVATAAKRLDAGVYALLRAETPQLRE